MFSIWNHSIYFLLELSYCCGMCSLIITHNDICKKNCTYITCFINFHMFYSYHLFLHYNHMAIAYLHYHFCSQYLTWIIWISKWYVRLYIEYVQKLHPDSQSTWWALVIIIIHNSILSKYVLIIYQTFNNISSIAKK